MNISSVKGRLILKIYLKGLDKKVKNDKIKKYYQTIWGNKGYK